MSTMSRRIRRIGFTSANLRRTAGFYAALGFVAIGTEAVGAAELAVLGMAGDARRTAVDAARPAGRRIPAFRVPGPRLPRRRHVDRPLVSAYRDRGVGYGRRLRPRDGRGRPCDHRGRTSDPAAEHRACHGLQVPRPRRPSPRTAWRFLPGIGDRAWQAKHGASPFLGIDHTAIAVSDTARSRAFYEGLGFRAKPGSENQGPGQQHLDAIAADRVAVVPLVLPEVPPHLELLGYAVGLRRPMPPGTCAADLWSTRVLIEGASLPEDFDAKALRLSDGRSSVLIHDPDGHAVVITDCPETA